MRGEFLYQLGTYPRAFPYFEAIPDPNGFDITFVAASHLRQAQMYEVLRDRDAARKHYRLAAEIWARADEELAPQLAFIKQRLTAL
jgi:hypothetical protein